MAGQIRLCIGCGQRDDHPRHVIHKQQPWHMDCHVLSTGCATCKRQITGAEGKTGDELREHLMALREQRKG
jgi:hypothetical protein